MGPQNILHMPLLERYSTEKKTNHQNNPSKVQMELTPASIEEIQAGNPIIRLQIWSRLCSLTNGLRTNGLRTRATSPWGDNWATLACSRQLQENLLLAKYKNKNKNSSVIPCIMQGSQVNVDKKRIASKWTL